MRIIRQRFTDEQVADLMQLKWWQYDLPHCPAFSKVNFDRIENFLAFFKDVDLASFPKIPNNWKYVCATTSPDTCQLYNVSKDLELR